MVYRIPTSPRRAAYLAALTEDSSGWEPSPSDPHAVSVNWFICWGSISQMWLDSHGPPSEHPLDLCEDVFDVPGLMDDAIMDLSTDEAQAEDMAAWLERGGK